MNGAKVRFIRVNRYIIAIKFYRIGFVYFAEFNLQMQQNSD